ELGKLEVGKPGVDKQEQEENQEDEFDLTSSEDDSWYFLGCSKLRRLERQILECCHDKRCHPWLDNFSTSSDTLEVEAVVLTLATTGLLHEYRTLDLLSMMPKHSRDILYRKLPPAAEFKES
nr:hypothetical protein [Tanacetum cinerariifolium]